MRLRYRLLIILAGFGLVALVALISIYKWEDVTNVATVIGATTSLVGTVVGDFLGVQVGATGREQAEADRQRVEETSRVALSMLPPEAAEQVRRETGRQGPP